MKHAQKAQEKGSTSSVPAHTSSVVPLEKLKHVQKAQEKGNTSSIPAHTSSVGAKNKNSKLPRTVKVRGVTVGHKLKTVHPNKKLKVEFNEAGQPIGEMLKDLVLRLGTIARSGNYFPLTFKDWRLIPNGRKHMVWEFLQGVYEFDDPSMAHHWLFKSLARKWSGFKSRLKKFRYDVHNSDAARIRDRDPRVHEQQWKKLVSYWGTEEAKAQSEKNTLSSTHSTHHSAGTKSIACVRDEETNKRADGIIPRRDEIFIITHTRKDKSYTDSASAEIANKLLALPNVGQNDPMQVSQDSDPTVSSYCRKDDKYAQVMGPEKPGRVRGMGLGVMPTQLWGTSASSQAKRREAELLRESAKLKDHLNIVEGCLGVMESEVMDIKRMLLQLIAGKKPAESASSSMNAYYDGKNGENEVEGHHEGGNEEDQDMDKDGDEDETEDEDEIEDEDEDEDEADEDEDEEDEAE